MPLFEIETSSHIIITWAEDEQAATEVVLENYPKEPPLRITHRPRDTWVISKSALGITGHTDPCSTARDCLAKASGDKVHAIRLYMQHTGTDLDHARQGHRIEHGHGLVGQRLGPTAFCDPGECSFVLGQHGWATRWSGVAGQASRAPCGASSVCQTIQEGSTPDLSR